MDRNKTNVTICHLYHQTQKIKENTFKENVKLRRLEIKPIFGLKQYCRGSTKKDYLVMSNIGFPVSKLFI